MCNVAKYYVLKCHSPFQITNMYLKFCVKKNDTVLVFFKKNPEQKLELPWLIWIIKDNRENYFS